MSDLEMHDWFNEAEFMQYLNYSKQDIVFCGYDAYMMFCMGGEL